MDTATELPPSAATGTRDIATSYWVEADGRPGRDLPFFVWRADAIDKVHVDVDDLPEPVRAALAHAIENVDSLTCAGDVCIAAPIGYYLDGYEEPERDAYRPFYVFADGAMRCEDCGNDELGLD